MLRGIPHILSPELLKILCEMGHSDRIVIADGNFPAESMGRDAHVIHMEGHGVPEILEAILLLFPLDTYVKHPVCLMSVMDGDSVETPIWNQYGTLVEAFDSRGRSAIGHMDSMRRQRKLMPLSPPARRRFMPISCCKKG